jgi:hypothetical protein
MPLTPEALATEFDTLMVRAGLSIPAERRAQVMEGFAELRGQVELLRGPRTAAAEPSNIFHLSPLKDA